MSQNGYGVNPWPKGRSISSKLCLKLSSEVDACGLRGSVTLRKLWLNLKPKFNDRRLLGSVTRRKLRLNP